MASATQPVASSHHQNRRRHHEHGPLMLSSSIRRNTVWKTSSRRTVGQKITRGARDKVTTTLVLSVVITALALPSFMTNKPSMMMQQQQTTARKMRSTNNRDSGTPEFLTTMTRRMTPKKSSYRGRRREEEEGVGLRLLVSRLRGGGDIGGENTSNDPRGTALNLVEPSVRPFVEKLHSSDQQYDKIYGKFCNEIYELQRKLHADTKEIFKTRSGIYCNIPDFWVLALSAHEDVKHAISNKDMEILRYLENIEVEMLAPPKKGFTLRFKFRSDNPYFDHPELSKTYEMDPEVPTLEPDLISVSANPSQIKWKNLDPRKSAMVDGAGEDDDDNDDHKYKHRPSFFHWFTSIDIPPPPEFDKEVDEAERHYFKMIREALAADCAIAYAVKDDILPHAVEYYTGEQTIIASTTHHHQNDDNAVRSYVEGRGEAEDAVDLLKVDYTEEEKRRRRDIERQKRAYDEFLATPDAELITKMQENIREADLATATTHKK